MQRTPSGVGLFGAVVRVMTPEPRTLMQSRWLIQSTNPEYVRYLSQTASISPVFAQILINRGIKTAAEARDFLCAGITCLSDPFELPSMKAAVERVKTAFHRKERVLIHGDYDTDGLTATAILVGALRSIGLDVHYFIPNRMLHGYGFHPPAVDLARRLGVTLIITVDCGISSFEAVSYAHKAGIDVIVTDHHEPLAREGRGARGNRGEEFSGRQSTVADTSFLIPDSVAVVNSKLGTSHPGLSNLSGAGVAFKVAEALAMAEGVPYSRDDLLPLLDLAALGTLADVVPLTGENRIILREGLKLIQAGSRPGIRALSEVSGLNGKDAKAGRLLYTLVPRINAAGRIDDANDVVRLLLSGSEEESSRLSSWLSELNRRRQQIEGEVYREALTQLQGKEHASAIVLAGEGWHEGVLGIVAARIAEEFHLPAFLFSIKGEIAKGSARSIPSFDVCRGLSEGADLLLSFGGHKQAAGMQLRAADLPAFEAAISRIVQRHVGQSGLQAVLTIDTNIRLSDVTHELVQELALLEPCGCGNPEPLIGSKELEVVSPRIVGERHLKMRLKKASLSIDAIGFGMGAHFGALQDSVLVDAVYTPEVNDWNGGRSLQLVLRAVRPSA